MNSGETFSSANLGQIQFVTIQPEGSPFATLERRVIVTGPPEILELMNAGNIRILDELVTVLKDPARSWAAEVLLAALTRNEEKIVDTYQARPEEWWDSLGKTAHDRWQKWLTEQKNELTWDSVDGVFKKQE
jgi:hypothetical protein